MSRSSLPEHAWRPGRLSGGRHRRLLPITLLLALSAPAQGGELLAATRDGDLRRAMALARDGASVTESGEQGDTPLHWAAFNGQEALAHVLLERGARVDARVRNGNTPLHQAAYAGHVDMVKLLLAAGAEPDARNGHDLGPLALAERNGHTPVVALLLARGATPARTRLTPATAPSVDVGRLRGMTRELGALPPLVLRVPDPPASTTVRLKPIPSLVARRPAAAQSSDPGAPGVAVGPAARPAPEAWLALGSFRSDAEAHEQWQALRGRVPAGIAGLEPVVVRVQVQGRGAFHRLRVGPLDVDEARRVCRAMRAGPAECLVVSRLRSR